MSKSRTLFANLVDVEKYARQANFEKAFEIMQGFLNSFETNGMYYRYNWSYSKIKESQKRRIKETIDILMGFDLPEQKHKTYKMYVEFVERTDGCWAAEPLEEILARKYPNPKSASTEPKISQMPRAWSSSTIDFDNRMKSAEAKKIEEPEKKFLFNSI